ncbi:MAG: diadenylate cyclase CdaA [Dehalococcoidia bacterium]
MPNFDHVQEVLRQFRPESIIEVLFISVVVFLMLRVMSGTRAMTQLRGAIVLLLAAVVLGRIFDLDVINFLVENSFTALLIAALVTFQPEIRRGLDRLGRTNMREWLDRPRYEQVIDSVVQAAARMSVEKHGALFVVERDTGLQDVIETGVTVDARVSPELLAGIFYPNSPLHDMAVVLRDDRVVAASCQLPLANDVTLENRKLGTRHRAAIGITEHTDAISIVVSEETGEISVALAGRLTQVDDERRLRAVMERLLEPGAAARRNGHGGRREP